MLQFLRSLFGSTHDFGHWRKSETRIVDGKKFTFYVRYCKECGVGQFRRTVEEAEEPEKTLSKMLFEVNRKDSVGEPIPDMENLWGPTTRETPNPKIE